MKLDNNGYLLITEFEGLSLKPYLCPAKLASIGYGNTYYPNGQKVTLLDPPITKDIAFDMFKGIADSFAKAVSKLVTSPVNQNQFNACVSFAYNCGIANFKSSTLLKKINLDPNDKSIKIEFSKWVRGGGDVLPGLVNRRNKESLTYFKL